MDIRFSDSSFAKSLKPIFDDARLKWLDPEMMAHLLDEYWSAVTELCPESFKEPKKSLLFKTAGVSVLHSIFPGVVAYLNSVGKRTRELTKDDLKQVLEQLPDLNDEFWSSENQNGAKRFLGEAGYRELANSWRKNVPKPEE